MTGVLCEVIAASSVRPVLQRTLDRWKTNVWGTPGHDGIQWALPEWYVLVPHGSEYVSRVGIVSRSIRIAAERVDVAGFCEVTTKPAYRGKGFASQALRCAAGFIRRELALPFGLLLCEPDMIPFYELLEWREIDERPVCELPDGSGSLPHLRCMVLELANRPWPAGSINLRGLPW